MCQVVQEKWLLKKVALASSSLFYMKMLRKNTQKVSRLKRGWSWSTVHLHGKVSEKVVLKLKIGWPWSFMWRYKGVVVEGKKWSES